MQNQKQQARELFFGTSQTQKEIAQSIGVSDRTIRSWIKEGSWAAMKRAAFTMPTVIVNNISAQLVALQDSVNYNQAGVPTLKQATVIQKLVNSLVKLSSYTSDGRHYQMMTSLLMYTQTIDIEFAKKLADYGDRYLKDQIDCAHPFDMEFGVKPTNYNATQSDAVEEDPDLLTETESGTKTEVKSPESPVNTEPPSEEKNISAPSKTSEQDNNPTPQNNTPTSSTSSNNNTSSPSERSGEVTPSGVRWHSPGYVIDPQNGLKRRIKQGEIDEFLRLGMKVKDLYEQ